jgi:DNA end-binding protein Ku
LKTCPYGQIAQWKESLAMATTVWKGHLTFGLISIPVRLFAAARGERVSFNQLHNVCHSRLKQPLFCPVCNRNVERSEIVKGYEYDKDQYVLFSEDELDKIEPSTARVMEILEFVKLGEMDPLYFDSSYYITPEDPGLKAYKLLMQAMEETGYGAIAKITMHQREHIVIIRPGAKNLTLHTMFYSNEIRAAETINTDKVEVKDQEKKLAEQLIQSLAAPFKPEKYRDEYSDNVRAMIAAKLQGQEVAEAPQTRLAPVIDLMEALKKSIAEKQAPGAAPAPAAGPVAVPAGKKPPARAVQPAPAAQKRGKKVG